MLKQTINNIENILSSLEDTMQKEHNNLLDSNYIETLEFIKNKKILFEKLLTLNKKRICLEKKYNFFAPYKNNEKLKKKWILIVKKCTILHKLNFSNKVLLNKRIYLNQHLLELFPDKKYITYDVEGNLKI